MPLQDTCPYGKLVEHQIPTACLVFHPVSLLQQPASHLHSPGTLGASSSTVGASSRHLGTPNLARLLSVSLPLLVQAPPESTHHVLR